jgi:hypothetical protein
MSNCKKRVLIVTLFAAFSSPAYAFLDGVVTGLTSVTNNLIDSTESVTNNTMNNATTTALSLSSNPGKMADRIGQMADRIGYMGDRIVTTEGLIAGLAHKMIDGPSKQQQAPQQQFGWGFSPNKPAAAPVNYQNPGYGYNNGYNNGYNSGYNNSDVHQRPVAHPSYNQNQNQSHNNYSSNPYSPGYAAPVPAPSYGYSRPDNSRYSASNMIFGQPGGTYTAQRQPTQPVGYQAGYQQNNPYSNTHGNPQGYQQGYQTAFQPAHQQPARKVSGFSFAPKSAENTSSNHCGYSYGVPVKCR